MSRPDCANCGHQHPSWVEGGPPPFVVVYGACETDDCSCVEWAKMAERADAWPKDPLRDVIIEAKMLAAHVRKTTDTSKDLGTTRRLVRLEATIEHYLKKEKR